MSGPVLEKLKSVCGNVHLWVVGVNFAITAVGVGIAWGSLNADVAALRRELEQYSLRQEAWDHEEHRADDIHRERINQIEAQIFQMLRDNRSRASE